MFSAGDRQPSETQSLRSLPLSAPERRLLLALVWGEPLGQAAERLGLSLSEARQVLTRLQQRAGVASRPALIARAVAHRWAG
jgi:DNA-binding NarL/FixJ family response regulator